MIKIDFKTFFRHHYWFGWYFWNECYDHKHVNTYCDDCSQGKWTWIGPAAKVEGGKGSLFPADYYRIFKMPMNNVHWKVPDEDDA